MDSCILHHTAHPRKAACAEETHLDPLGDLVIEQHPIRLLAIKRITGSLCSTIIKEIIQVFWCEERWKECWLVAFWSKELRGGKIVTFKKELSEYPPVPYSASTELEQLKKHST